MLAVLRVSESDIIPVMQCLVATHASVIRSHEIAYCHYLQIIVRISSYEELENVITLISQKTRWGVVVERVNSERSLRARIADFFR